MHFAQLPDFEYGYPPPEPTPWFGLWCPLLDCIVLVSYKLNHLQKIQALTVSKILTVIVRLDHKLYQNNQIDNTCASNWTIEDPELINFTAVIKKNFYNSDCCNIVPSSLTNISEVNKFQTWLFFVWRWVKYLDGIADPFVDLPGYAWSELDHNKLSKHIYQVLFLEHDPVSAEATIQQLIETYEQNISN
jgi:hypothetical protein